MDFRLPKSPLFLNWYADLPDICGPVTYLTVYGPITVNQSQAQFVEALLESLVWAGPEYRPAIYAEQLRKLGFEIRTFRREYVDPVTGRISYRGFYRMTGPVERVTWC